MWFRNLDNILVFLENLEENIKHVYLVLKNVRIARLYGKLKKCEFYVERFELLDFEIKLYDVHIVKLSINSISDWWKPKIIKEVQIFLKFADFDWCVIP